MFNHPPIQLSLWQDESHWWRKLSVWKIRKLVASVQRPVEDEALDNIYHETRALNTGAWRRGLNSLERRVYELDKYSLCHLPRYYTPYQRYEWIAARLHGVVVGPRHVEQILINITHIIRHVGYLVTLSEKMQRREAARQMLPELLYEKPNPMAIGA